MQPIRPIRNEADYELALQEIDRHLDAPLGSPERERLEDATDFVAYYEAKHHPISPPEPMGDYQGPLYAPHPGIAVRAAAVDYTGQAEWDDGSKDEEQFGDDDIVRIFERRGLIIGVKKGGGSVILGENNG